MPLVNLTRREIEILSAFCEREARYGGVSPIKRDIERHKAKYAAMVEKFAAATKRAGRREPNGEGE